MSQVATAQVSFNGGALSRRLRARIDQSIYAIAVGAMVGWAPTVEGAAEAMPGTIHVAQAPGPCRLIRFEFNATQGHVLEFSDLLVRVYTNDALVAVDDVPVTVESPYSFAQVQALRTHQSYDVLYTFLGDMQPQQFIRNGATAFGFEPLVLENGPFEPRNKDKAVRVAATGLTGAVQLQADAPLFAAGDVGGLFKMEAEDFGDITAWEPYITVTAGQLLTANERVYRVIGGNGAPFRTGGLTPVHTEGVEWDGIAKGTDLNGKPAAGVQLEFVHDRFGILRITGFTSATEVDATVLRALPFSAVNATVGTGGGNYAYNTGYYDPTWDDWVPPPEAASYQYGTWRWSFGAFSDARGWPQCGCVWNGRLVLAKDSTIYTSVAEDLTDFAAINEFGEVSADMAVTRTIADPNQVLHMEPGDKTVLVFTASGTFALGQENLAAPFGPGNAQCPRQNSVGAGTAPPVNLDARTLMIDRSNRRIFEVEFDPGRGVEAPVDLTRYARHIGTARFAELAAQQQPFNHVWARRGDGTLACAAYLPEERVLGLSERQLAPGAACRSLCSITDTAGEFDQVWLAIERAAAWHVCRMAPWRHDGERDAQACMVDLGATYDGEPLAAFTLAHLPNAAIAVIADGRLYRVQTDGAGHFTLPDPASRVTAGLEFAAYIEGLPVEAGGDNGPAIARKARWGRSWFRAIATGGLRFGTPADADQAADLADMETLEAAAFDPLTGAEAEQDAFRFREAPGSSGRWPRLRIERTAPLQATLLAWGGVLNMEKA